MTEVVGPPLPPERFSSPAILEAYAPAGGAKGFDLKISCDMAQAFEVPTEYRSGRATHRVPRTHCQIASPLPHRSIAWIDDQNMGRRPAHRKRATTGWMQPLQHSWQDGRPGSAIRARL